MGRQSKYHTAVEKQVMQVKNEASRVSDAATREKKTQQTQEYRELLEQEQDDEEGPNMAYPDAGEIFEEHEAMELDEGLILNGFADEGYEEVNPEVSQLQEEGKKFLTYINETKSSRY